MLKNTTHGRGERKCPCVLQTESKFEAIFFCEMRPLLPIFVSCVDSNVEGIPEIGIAWRRSDADEKGSSSRSAEVANCMKCALPQAA